MKGRGTAQTSITLVRPLPDGNLYVDDGALLGKDRAVAAMHAPDDRTAAIALVKHAEALVDAVPPGCSKIRTTAERGILSHLVRRLLPPRAVHEAPDAIIDTCGNPEALTGALAELNDRGFLILGASPGRATWSLDTYPHLHSRGLSVVGVPLRPAEASARASEELVDEAVSLLVICEEGVCTRCGHWYRVAARQ